MPAGGARVGAGRKPTKPRPFKPVTIQGGVINGKEPDTDGVSAIPPADLPPEQRDFWHRYAGLAIEKRTLTVHTVPAFRLLCKMDAMERAIEATLAKDGLTCQQITTDVTSGEQSVQMKAHPLMSAQGRTAKQVETLMARFGLAPFGKAEPIIAKQKAANPWAKVGEK